MKKLLITLVGMLSIASFNFANAAIPGAYVGLGLGSSGYSSSSGGFLSGKLLGGYNFNQYVGIEGAYSHYSRSTYNMVNSESAIVKAYLPLSLNFDIFAGLGAGHANPAPGSVWSSTAAAGLNYYFNTRISATLQYDRTVSHSNLVTLGAAYHF